MRRCRASLLRRAAAAALAAHAPRPAQPPQLARGLASWRSPGAASSLSRGGSRPPVASLLFRRAMFIQTAPTPNPASLMFLPGKTVLPSGTADFPSARDGMRSPLARALFAVDGVASVFLGSDFVTVRKAEGAEWASLKPEVFAAIMDFYASDQPVVLDGDALQRDDTAVHDGDSELVAMIKELLATRIRPAVAEDGGDIVYRGFDVDTGVVTVKLMGSCSGCPSSSITLKSGIENMLKHYVPEVTAVEEDSSKTDLEIASDAALADMESKLSH